MPKKNLLLLGGLKKKFYLKTRLECQLLHRLLEFHLEQLEVLLPRPFSAHPWMG